MQALATQQGADRAGLGGSVGLLADPALLPGGEAPATSCSLTSGSGIGKAWLTRARGAKGSSISFVSVQRAETPGHAGHVHDPEVVGRHVADDEARPSISWRSPSPGRNQHLRISQNAQRDQASSKRSRPTC